MRSSPRRKPPQRKADDMAYTPYASLDDYSELLPEGEPVTEDALRQASRHIDSLTFNRIVAAGFSNLTRFQQEVIKEVTCRQALFETENEDVIRTVLSSYSINGVSMQFGQGWNIFIESGVAMQRDVYAMLKQTGLCCRLAR